MVYGICNSELVLLCVPRWHGFLTNVEPLMHISYQRFWLIHIHIWICLVQNLWHVRGGGGQGRKFRTPSSLFDQNLAQVAGKGSSIPISPPKKFLKKTFWGGEGGWAGLGGQFQIFWSSFSFSYLALIVTAMALHTM